MAEARLSVAVSTKGAVKAEKELNNLAKTSKVVDINVKKTGKTFKSFGKNASAAIASIDGPLGGISSRVSALTTVLTNGTAATTLFAGALVGAGAVLVQGISALDEYDVNLRRVNATIKATGDSVGFTGEQLLKEAESLALATLTSVDAVQKAQAKLLTFNRVLGDEFTRSIRLSQDLAEAGFGSIESNAILLGKALQDPIKGMSALSRVGVTLSEEQKRLAKEAVNVGDVFAAQAVILSAVEGQVKGVAAAVADGTIAGQIDTLGQNWDDLTRTIAANGEVVNWWKSTLSGASLVLQDINNLFRDDTTAELITKRAEAEAQYLTQLEKVKESTGRNRKAAQENAAATLKDIQVYTLAIEKSSKKDEEIASKNAEAKKKELEARKAITIQAKTEADAISAKEKKAADEKLARSKATAQKELETLLNLNNTEIEAINVKLSKRLAALQLSHENELISEQQFQDAITEVVTNAEIARGLVKKTQADLDDKMREEQLQGALSGIKSVSDSLIDAAVSGDSMGNAVKGAFIGIAKQAIKSGTDMLVKQLLLDKVAGKSFAVAKAAESEAMVLQTGLNTLASISAIPITGPAAAPGVAAAMTGVAQGMATGVIAAASAREQGGSLSAGQASTVAERGQLEILTPSSSSRIRTKQQMQQLMGSESNSTPTINVVNINQSNGPLDIETTTDDDGRIINLIRSTNDLDISNANSSFRKNLAAHTTTEARR